MYQYIQVKRENKTFFIECTERQLVLEIKKELLQFLLPAQLEPQDVRLYLGSTLLDESCSVYDQGIQNNSCLDIKLRTKMGDWEEPSLLPQPSVFNDRVT